MSNYSDNLSSIRKVRDARDKARDELYKMQIRYFALTREQKKFDQKELVSDDIVARNIIAVRKNIAGMKDQLNDIEAQLREIQIASDRLTEWGRGRDALMADMNELHDQISSIDKELSDRNISPNKKFELEAQKKALLDRIATEQREIKKLNGEIDALARELPSLKEKQGSLAQQKKRLEQQIGALQKKLNALIEQGQTFHPDKTDELNSSKSAIIEQTSQLDRSNKAVQASIGSLFADLVPQELIEQLNDRVPIMLFPVRMETKYKITDAAKQLWVRIYPDDIAVVTHEMLLTSTEMDAGQAHWKALWQAKDDNAKKQPSWSLLEKQCGVNRAAWVALQTKPLNWNNSESLGSENELEFPVVDLTKPAAWTQAPHTRTMPDKFVLLGFRKGELTFSKIGNQVNDIVVMGPAPLADEDKPSITRDAQDKRLQYSDDFKWMVDFDLALQSGLGLVITDKDLKSGSVIDGFDQLVVIGLKLSCDENDGKKLLEDLLDNHNYSREGLSLIKQGTPTNNTEEKDAGYSKKGSLAGISDHIEKGDYLFEYSNDKRSATDGQRLAEYLGIEYRPLRLVSNSQLKEYVEAVAMNKALYASTLGYFVHSMLNEVFTDSAILELRDHFTNYVAGRGPIAAIRVGNQPYGIIPTSAFSKWKYPARAAGVEAPLSLAVATFGDSFLNQLYKFILYLESEWEKLVPQLSFIHREGDAGANLISVLGLNPTSVEFFQRVGYSFDYLKNLEAFSWGGKYFGDVFKTVLDQIYVKQIMRNFGYRDTEDDGASKPVPLLLQLVFQHYHTRLDNNNLIDGQPTSEDSLIKPYDAKNHLNYIDWLIANVSDPTNLENQDFGGATPPNSLLYMLLKNSLLVETSHSLVNYFQKNNIAASELIRSRKFMNMSTSPSVSPWEVFQAPANKVVASETVDRPLFEYIHSPHFAGPAGTGIIENLDEFKWALTVLKDMSTASLERAMTEHLDTLTYRLDAWQTSLFDLRLQEQRNILSGNSDRAKGIYLGAYGYLENVKPSVNKREKVSEQVLPKGLQEDNDNLYREANNGGYVHAPSLNHATAAAILRCGYLTHANAIEKEMLSINLSSERVRRAKYLVDGIRNGQTLEVLLGYQFERGLHDWSTRPVSPVILNQLIPFFQQAFPIKKTKVPQEGKVTGPEEVINDYHVVNGLLLSQVTADFPYGIADFPALSVDQINAIKTEKDNIMNTLDALRDLLTSESAYQLALGNFDRAAAVMQAISDSHMPPDIQVIDSARGTDLAFTNRVGVHFDSGLTSNPWPGIPMTEKANTEPGMNSWMGTLLGDPSNIQCLVKAVDKDGNVLTRADLTEIEDIVSLQDLQIQPIDFIYLIRNKLEESGTSELEGRFRYFFAKKNSVTDDTIVKIEFTQVDPAGDSTIKSLAEILPFADYIRNIVSGSRPLKARDYDSSSKKVTVSADNPDNINVPELQARLQKMFTNFNALMSQLQTAVADAITIKTEPVVNTLRDQLKVIADAGMVYAFPQSAVGVDQKQIDVLTTQGQSVLKRYESLLVNLLNAPPKAVDIDTKLAQILKDTTMNVGQKVNLLTEMIKGVVGDYTTIKVEQKVNLLTEMIKAVLGDDYVILPKFNFNDAVEITQVYNSRNNLLEYSTNTLKIPLAVNEWLHGVSLVRPKMHTLELIRMLNDTFNIISFQLEPIQMPYRDKASWLAVEYPPDTTIDHDTVSFISHNPQGFDPSKDQCGLLIDEWVEVIPKKEEVTGISFNYNQPNSVPPQALLLAVTPEETGNWKWENLVDTVLDTFDRARRRAVEPDLLDQQNGISTLLPALMSEFSTSKNGISLDYSLNIQFVLKEVMKLHKGG